MIFPANQLSRQTLLEFGYTSRYMAEILPFQAWRYDAARNPLAKVVTQPYDKITPEMQERYYRASPYNLVRIILGKAEAGDGPANNVYSRAAEFFREWRRNGVLVQDSKPSLYAYAQHFEPPGRPGKTAERRGFVALGRICDYSDQVVFRHEQTLAKPKADRLELLRATRAHFGQLFMLYDDPGRQIEAWLPWQQPATAEVEDDYGVTNRVWRVSDLAIINAVREAFAQQKLIIADGHHRYETALAYRNQQRAKGGNEAGPQPWDYVMMTFINLHSPGLVILPTHRVVGNLANFDEAAFAHRVEKFFVVEKLGTDQPAASLLGRLRSAPAESHALIAVTRKNSYLLLAKKDKLEAALAGQSARQRGLDVVVLHKGLFEHVLGLSEAAITEQKHVLYLRDAAQAVEQARRGEGEIAFLMNPVKVEQMRDLALAGELMPQKSTDFYPKLLSGLAIYALD
jgi:uncharacterized protein (DUF1015 family)